MQIYEITSKNSVTEGVMGRAFTSAITNKLLPGANPNTPGGASTAPGQRGNKAFDINSPQVALLATKAEASWTQTLKTMIGNSENPGLNTASLKLIDVEQALDDNVSGLLGFNIKDANAWQTPEGKQATAALASAKELVIKASTDPAQTPEQMEQSWLRMAQAIMEAQIIEEFMSKGAGPAAVQPAVTLGAKGEVMIGRQPARTSDPAQLAQMQALKAALEKAGV
jgi:hypothetical protein